MGAKCVSVGSGRGISGFRLWCWYLEQRLEMYLYLYMVGEGDVIGNALPRHKILPLPDVGDYNQKRGGMDHWFRLRDGVA